MGDRTRARFKLGLAPETPAGVREVLNWLTAPLQYASTVVPPQTDNHPFFRCPRMNAVLLGAAGSHETFARMTTRSDGGLHLDAQAQIKNDACEFQEFIRWLTPYIDNEPGDEIGFIVPFYEFEEIDGVHPIRHMQTPPLYEPVIEHEPATDRSMPQLR